MFIPTTEILFIGLHFKQELVNILISNIFLYKKIEFITI